ESNMGPVVEREVCAALGLRPVPATQVIARDRHAEFLWACAAVGATVEQVATEVRHLQRTEVGEVEEPFRAGQKGSSAMPHKRNPIPCERLAGLARLLRRNLRAEDERRTWSDEWRFRRVLEAAARVTLVDSRLDEAFSLARALRNTGAIFEALEEVETQ